MGVNVLFHAPAVPHRTQPRRHSAHMTVAPIMITLFGPLTIAIILFYIASISTPPNKRLKKLRKKKQQVETQLQDARTKEEARAAQRRLFTIQYFEKKATQRALEHKAALEWWDTFLNPTPTRPPKRDEEQPAPPGEHAPETESTEAENATESTDSHISLTDISASSRWNSYISRINTLKVEYLEAEMSGETWLYRPLLLDVENEHTSQFHVRFSLATDVLEGPMPDTLEGLDHAGSVLHAAEQAWRTAYRNAEYTGVPELDAAQRSTLRRAKRALAVALDERSPLPERLHSLKTARDLTQQIFEVLAPRQAPAISRSFKHTALELEAA